jgi:hypothetical protein
MDTTDSTYWIIQYSPDPFRYEPRNIGIFLHDGRSARCLMLGEKDKGCDPRYFCHAFDIDVDTGWIYLEWNHWFKSLAGSDSANIESVHAELYRLKVRDHRFGVTEPCAIEMDFQRKPDSVLRELFREFVTVPRLPNPSPFERDFNYVLQVSELMYHPTFHRDVEVEIGEGSGAAFVHFDAILEEPEPFGIKVIQFQRVQERTLIGQINDSLYSFNTSVNQGFLSPERCVVLHDQPTSSRSKHLDRLARHAKLLPLWDTKTPRELQRIALRQ